jgi:hypothetical protein
VLPLGTLLSTSDAVVRHGGAGTTLTAAAAGLPRLIAPGGADQPADAGVVDRRGNGLRRSEVTVADVRVPLADGPLRGGRRGPGRAGDHAGPGRGHRYLDWRIS